MDVTRVATELLDVCARDEQVARRIPEVGDAAAVRKEVRRLARERQLRIRTARMDDTVVVVRANAKIWTEDAATMRRKLTPKDDG